jgi:hypothetical protein
MRSQHMTVELTERTCLLRLRVMTIREHCVISLLGEIDFDSAQESRIIFLVIVEVNIMTDQRHSCVVFQD